MFWGGGSWLKEETKEYILVQLDLGFLEKGSFQTEQANMGWARRVSRNWTEQCKLCGMECQPGIANSYNLLTAVAWYYHVIPLLSHTATRAPSQDKLIYVIGRHFNVLNVQIICDVQMQLINIVARWPAPTHDSLILTSSMVGNRLQAGKVQDDWFIGE